MSKDDHAGCESAIFIARARIAEMQCPINLQAVLALYVGDSGSDECCLVPAVAGVEELISFKLRDNPYHVTGQHVV
jgi:hypothetical protein